MSFFVEPKNALETQTRAYVEDLLAHTKQRLQGALRVNPVTGNLYVPRNCTAVFRKTASRPETCARVSSTVQCAEVSQIPESYMGPLQIMASDGTTSQIPAGNGVANTDLLVFVTSRASYQCGAATLAYATACYLDQRDRPIVGNINFCLNNSATSRLTAADHRALALHEMLHVLGFSSKLFGLYRDPAGAPRTPRCPAAAGCTADDDAGYPHWDPRTGAYVVSFSTLYTTEGGAQFLATPAVTAAARAYYGCPTLPGAALEDGGGGGTAGTHWEQRSLFTELMTGALDPTFPYLLSEFSLALMADTGWYAVNLSAADMTPLRWGRGRGCAFGEANPAGGAAAAGCGAAAPFCKPRGGQGCSFDRSAVAVCAAGAALMGAGCEFYYPYTNGRCDNRSGDATALAVCGGADCRGSYYGPGSACFQSSLVVNGYELSSGPNCYAFRCAAGPATAAPGAAQSRPLEVRGPDGVWRPCSGAGWQTLAVPGYTGSIDCPPDSDLCLDSCLAGRCADGAAAAALAGAMATTAAAAASAAAGTPAPAGANLTYSVALQLRAAYAAAEFDQSLTAKFRAAVAMVACYCAADACCAAPAQVDLSVAPAPAAAAAARRQGGGGGAASLVNVTVAGLGDAGTAAAVAGQLSAARLSAAMADQGLAAVTVTDPARVVVRVVMPVGGTVNGAAGARRPAPGRAAAALLAAAAALAAAGVLTRTGAPPRWEGAAGVPA